MSVQADGVGGEEGAECTAVSVADGVDVVM